MVSEVVAQVPRGRVVTYGDVAVACGKPYAARQVGGVAHYGDPNLPWHRLVNRSGGLASGYHGGRATQAEHLRAEGVECREGKVVDFEERRWRPEHL